MVERFYYNVILRLNPSNLSHNDKKKIKKEHDSTQKLT